MNTVLNTTYLVSANRGSGRAIPRHPVSLTSWPIIFDEVDDGMACEVLFLDLQKAFDTIDHVILIEKPKLYGIR